ncbi:hypothetical protein [Flaviflexus massiliensis]|uniref:hypothetical protein n=1 Tax=Flaviflexus massiliensis TaxID=1522309 RepID=UPI0006D564D8|nr:hypothetical protein [Flaviflexus massiliensis]
MKRPFRTAFLLLTIPLALAACSSDNEEASSETSSELSVDPTEDDLSPGINDVPQPGPDDSSNAEEPELPEPTEDAEEPVDPADGPSKQEVADGLRVMMMEELAVTEEDLEESGATELMEEFYTCATDSVYDSVSTEALVALAESNIDAELSEEDSSILNTATIECGNSISTR